MVDWNVGIEAAII